jgi:glucose-1-phosphate thymidylyltransferase
MTTAAVITAILPCAGLASRLQMHQKHGLYAKELLPIAYRVDPETRQAFPVPVIHSSLEIIRLAGVSRCVIVTSERKPELAAYLGDGSDFSMSFAYVRQDTPLGLADAVNRGCRWTSEGITCMLLPDTILEPKNALRMLLDDLQSDVADVMLGVFPTETPEQLGPVDFNEEGMVRQVLEKPLSTSLYNTWGVAVWKSDFSHWMNHELHRFEAAARPALSMGSFFDLAISHGFRVGSRYFANGSFVDAGTSVGLGVIFDQQRETLTLPPCVCL